MTSAPSGGSRFRILGATLNYGLAGYLPQLINFLLLPVFTAYLTPADMGIVEICVAAQVLVASVLRTGLPGALSRLYFEHREGSALADLFTSISAASAVTSAAGIGVLLLIGPPIFGTFLPEVPFHPYFDLALLATLLQVAPELQSRLLQAQERSGLAARLTLTFAVLGTASKVLFVVGLRWGPAGVLWAEVLTNGLYALVAAARHRRELSGRIRMSILRSAFSYGLPLVPHHAGGWLHQFAGRWVLSAMATIAMVGHLGIAARIVSPLLLAGGAFATAFAPVYFAWRTDLPTKDALAEARRTSSAALVLSATAGLGAATFGVLAVRHFLPATYAASEVLIGVLGAGLVVRIIYNVVGVELLYAKRTQAISVAFLVGAAVNLAISIALVPSWGAMAIAFSQLVGTLIGVGITAVLARQTFPLAIAGRGVVALVFAAAAMIAMPFAPWRWGLGGDFALAGAAFCATTLVTLALAGVRPATVRATLQAIRRRRGPATQGPAVPVGDAPVSG